MIELVEPSPKSKPWMAQISIKGKHWCGGSLINNEFVLTSASCFCGTAGLCDRKGGEVREGVPVKIRVSTVAVLQ